VWVGTAAEGDGTACPARKACAAGDGDCDAVAATPNSGATALVLSLVTSVLVLALVGLMYRCRQRKVTSRVTKVSAFYESDGEIDTVAGENHREQPKTTRPECVGLADSRELQPGWSNDLEVSSADDDDESIAESQESAAPAVYDIEEDSMAQGDVDSPDSVVVISDSSSDSGELSAVVAPAASLMFDDCCCLCRGSGGGGERGWPKSATSPGGSWVQCCSARRPGSCTAWRRGAGPSTVVSRNFVWSCDKPSDAHPAYRTHRSSSTSASASASISGTSTRCRQASPCQS
jgi:hypothetical protein